MKENRTSSLFEISPVRVEQGRKLAEQNNLNHIMSFRMENAFEVDLQSYDLVYWNNALHHMLDTEAAVAWSYEHLVPGGWFIMDDFVRPNRFQWTDENLDYATRVRQSLPERFLRNPGEVSQRLRAEISRPSVEQMIKIDPTEAADSERILPAIRKTFEEPEITLTGGYLYHLALNDVIAHFNEDNADDIALLQSILLSDELLAQGGLTQYATAIAQR